jgi:hypothetical protein
MAGTAANTYHRAMTRKGFKVETKVKEGGIQLFSNHSATFVLLQTPGSVGDVQSHKSKGECPYAGATAVYSGGTQQYSDHKTIYSMQMSTR